MPATRPGTPRRQRVSIFIASITASFAPFDPLALGDQQGQYLAVHRRLDLAVAIGVIKIAGTRLGRRTMVCRP